jgi:hypothetical protein
MTAGETDSLFAFVSLPHFFFAFLEVVAIVMYNPSHGMVNSINRAGCAPAHFQKDTERRSAACRQQDQIATHKIVGYGRIFFRHSCRLASFLRSEKTNESPRHIERVPFAAKCALRSAPLCLFEGSCFLCFLAILVPRHIHNKPSEIYYRENSRRA